MTDRVPDGVSGQETLSRAGGRPAYKPSDEQRSLVRELRGKDGSIGGIAAALGISRNTLRKHFAEELKVSPAPAAVDQQLDLAGTHKIEVARPPGRPEYEPTYREREDVRLWAADDWSEERMAQQLGIARETLRKHFADDIQYGADKVRTQALRDLARGSAQGKTGASAKLLELTSMVAPPSGPKQDVPDLGKKAQAIVDAKTADHGTSWADLTTPTH